MKYWLMVLLAFFLAACGTSAADFPGQQPEASALYNNLPVIGQAPELTSEVWLNTSKPIQLTNMRGQVVLLEMWTFG
jgi:hypothetical protein